MMADDLMGNPTVRQIVATYLSTHGYTGLYNECCGCALNDLMPCGEGYVDCRAGYRQEAREGDDNIDFDVGEWFTGPEKPEARGA